MAEDEQVYTVGIWNVKKGREEEFVELWKSLAQWTNEHQAGAIEGFMNEDINDPQRFISFGPWESAEDVDNWKASDVFRDFLAKANELCDSMQPMVVQTIAHVSRPQVVSPKEC